MSTEIPPTGREPGAFPKLQVQATEHWSLLATRSLIYTEFRQSSKVEAEVICFSNQWCA
jgi:hypothetical protein